MQGMKFKTVSADCHASGTYRCKIKFLLALADEVFHASAVAVITNDLPVRKFFHVGDDECVHICHLIVRFFDFESLGFYCYLILGITVLSRSKGDACILKVIPFRILLYIM